MNENTHILEGDLVSDGAGVQIRRLIATSELPLLDPFLLLDEFKSDDPENYSGGFPDHPHRGFETITYLLHGKMEHQDSMGYSGVLEEGGIQRMTAGRGVIHSEMPRMLDGLMQGYQLWINLPASEKMCEPSYRDHSGDSFSVAHFEGTTVTVIAGRIAGEEGPVQTVVPIQYFDVELEDGSGFLPETPELYNRIIVPLEGEIRVSDDHRNYALHAGSSAMTFDHDVKITASGHSRMLYLAGRPLNETVARGGPFVMNTREEVMQAFRDYETGKMGEPPGSR